MGSWKLEKGQPITCDSSGENPYKNAVIWWDKFKSAKPHKGTTNCVQAYTIQFCFIIITVEPITNIISPKYWILFRLSLEVSKC